MSDQIADSAASGTSLLTGVKVNSGVLGLDHRVTFSNCSQYGSDTKLKSILHHFMDEGLLVLLLVVWSVLLLVVGCFLCWWLVGSFIGGWLVL